MKVEGTDFNTGNKDFELQYKKTSELIKKGKFEKVKDKSIIETVSNFKELLEKKGFISKYIFCIVINK